LIQALGLIPTELAVRIFCSTPTASITNARKPMRYIEIFMALYGIALLVVGYRRNQRKMMAAAGMALMVAGTIGYFADKLDQPAATIHASVTSAPNP
jgi:lipoprotein signal peptidase